MCVCAFFFVSLRQTFFADPFVQEHVRLDAVVCLCDSPRLLRTLVASPSPPPPPPACASTAPVAASATDGAAATLVLSQLALSDRVLLNKSDLITADEVIIVFSSPH